MAESASIKILIAAPVAAVLTLGAGYMANAAKNRSERQAVAVAMTGGNPAMAPAAMRRYGCGGCHSISGVPGADGKVGPALVDMRERVYIAGSLPNTPDNLIGWIVSPQRFSPQSAMPATGVTPAEARDLAAFLYAQ